MIPAVDIFDTQCVEIWSRRSKTISREIEEREREIVAINKLQIQRKTRLKDKMNSYHWEDNKRPTMKAELCLDNVRPPLVLFYFSWTFPTSFGD